MNVIELTDQELATVIAALRFWVRVGNTNSHPEYDIAGDAGKWFPLSDEEVNYLANDINLGEKDYVGG